MRCAAMNRYPTSAADPAPARHATRALTTVTVGLAHAYGSSARLVAGAQRRSKTLAQILNARTIGAQIGIANPRG